MRFFSSESVTEGHPDKLCDSIADHILDTLLRQDPGSKVAVEVLAAPGIFHVAGEVNTTGWANVPLIVRDVLNSVGYSSRFGLDSSFCGVLSSIGQQSAQIAQAVAKSFESRGNAGGKGAERGTSRLESGSGNSSVNAESRTKSSAECSANTGGSGAERGTETPTKGENPYLLQGAGDQGIIFGYATDEISALMPAPIWLAHRLAERLARVRKEGTLPYLGPDGKTQITLGYDSAHRPKTVDTIVISTQHVENTDLDILAQDVKVHVIEPVLQKYARELDCGDVKTFINPAGEFVLGGPAADTGVLGRKNAVDTYGGAARHGGGALSGKDASKVDRCAAYALRWAAKNIVAAGLCSRVELQAAYAIGVANPVGFYIETFGTHTCEIDKLYKAVSKVFDFRPAAIVEHLRLLEPVYSLCTNYGHFGREGFSWEEINRAEDLLRHI